ncbi:hypothetical protein J2S78_003412 [Salibacterium salarium]|nr:hypothetical protein [Salibacterium salarium]
MISSVYYTFSLQIKQNYITKFDKIFMLMSKNAYVLVAKPYPCVSILTHQIRFVIVLMRRKRIKHDIFSDEGISKGENCHREPEGSWKPVQGRTLEYGPGRNSFRAVRCKGRTYFCVKEDVDSLSPVKEIVNERAKLHYCKKWRNLGGTT